MDTCRADTELFQCWETLMNRKSTYSRRFKFDLVIYLFSEGATEVDYLEQFIRQNSKTENVKIIRRKICSDQIKLTQSAIDWAKNNPLQQHEEIWLIFDDDGKSDNVKQAYTMVDSSKYKINIAYNKPCIEIWPLLHNHINNVSNQSQAQSKLHEIMKSYKHDHYPYFDLSKMPDYEYAVAQAKSWKTSLNNDPEYVSSKFAGIYKLTEKIKNI